MCVYVCCVCMCVFSVLCMCFFLCVVCVSVCAVCHVCVLCVFCVCFYVVCVLCVFSVCCVHVLSLVGPWGDEGTTAWEVRLSCPVQAQPVDPPVLSSPVSWTAPAEVSCSPTPLPLFPPFLTLLPLYPFVLSPPPPSLPAQHSSPPQPPSTRGYAAYRLGGQWPRLRPRLDHVHS
jgi:hypothetical protein